MWKTIKRWIYRLVWGKYEDMVLKAYRDGFRDGRAHGINISQNAHLYQSPWDLFTDADSTG